MHLRLFLDHFWPQKSQIAYCLTGSLLTGSLARGQLMQQLQLCQNIDTKRTVALSAGGLVINISKNILTGVTYRPYIGLWGINSITIHSHEQIRFHGKSEVKNKIKVNPAGPSTTTTDMWNTRDMPCLAGVV